MSTTTERLSRVAPMRRVSDAAWYAGSVVVGAILVVMAALQQPFNENELKQMAPYASGSLHQIIGETRQPPLDPLLGAMVQHLLGEGQLRQRLVPVLAGIGALAVMGLLLRRLGVGVVGAFALLVMATAPLFVRYSAYSRPYALPMFLMVIFVYAAQGWLDTHARRWLVLAAVATLALLLARVPEPVMFLLTTMVSLAWFAFRGRLSWSQVWPLIAIPAVGLMAVGYPTFRALRSQTGGSTLDSTLSRFTSRFDRSLHQLVTEFASLIASSFPWWPITLAVIVAAFAWPVSRRRLLGWWFLFPLLVPPTAWVLIYHFLSPYSLQTLPYRARSALFFVPAYTVVVLALAAGVVETVHRADRRLRAGLAVVLAAALVTQLPATGRVLVQDLSPDVGEAAAVLTRLPEDAIVLYDTPSPSGYWHQPFRARPRYLGDRPEVLQVSQLMRHPKSVPPQGPVYLLMLDSECAYSTVCDEAPADWNGEVGGWRVVRRFDRYTLYEPRAPLSGRVGVLQALRDFAASLGPDLGSGETFGAAALLKLRGRSREGKSLINQMYEDAEPGAEERIRHNAERRNQDPFQH